MEFTEAEHDSLKLGNYFALKTAELLKRAHSLGLPFIFEQPQPTKGTAHMHDLREVSALLGLKGVEVTDLDQCMVGAQSVKPTSLVGHLVDLSALQGVRCDHEARWHTYKNLRGRICTVWSAHEPIAGRKDERGAWGRPSRPLTPNGSTRSWPMR